MIGTTKIKRRNSENGSQKNMTHIAIVEMLDGKSADWMEKVSDEQYQAGSRAE